MYHTEKNELVFDWLKSTHTSEECRERMAIYYAFIYYLTVHGFYCQALSYNIIETCYFMALVL